MNLATALIQAQWSKPALEFSVLVGSSTNDMAATRSDWEIAVARNPQLPWLKRIAQTDTFRHPVAAAQQECESRIDFIDLAKTNLTMRANVAEDSVPLSGENTSACARFLRHT